MSLPCFHSGLPTFRQPRFARSSTLASKRAAALAAVAPELAELELLVGHECAVDLRRRDLEHGLASRTEVPQRDSRRIGHAVLRDDLVGLQRALRPVPKIPPPRPAPLIRLGVCNSSVYKNDCGRPASFSIVSTCAPRRSGGAVTQILARRSPSGIRFAVKRSSNSRIPPAPSVETSRASFELDCLGTLRWMQRKISATFGSAAGSAPAALEKRGRARPASFLCIPWRSTIARDPRGRLRRHRKATDSSPAERSRSLAR